MNLEGDISEESFCKEIVERTIERFGKVDILVDKSWRSFSAKKYKDITAEQLELTFKVNVFPMFYLTKAALPYLKRGSSIINTTSVTAYQGHKELIDYSSTKGAITAFTRSLSQSLVDKGIRVNGVAPGPIWTPLIVSSFSSEEVATFGSDTPMKRAGEPYELAPAYVYLASDDSSYVTGQVIHVNGGTMVES